MTLPALVTTAVTAREFEGGKVAVEVDVGAKLAPTSQRGAVGGLAFFAFG